MFKSAWTSTEAVTAGKRPEIAEMMIKCWDNDPLKRLSFDEIVLFKKKRSFKSYMNE